MELLQGNQDHSLAHCAVQRERKIGKRGNCFAERVRTVKE